MTKTLIKLSVVLCLLSVVSGCVVAPAPGYYYPEREHIYYR